LPQVERALAGLFAGSGLGATITAAMLPELAPIDDIRATGGYRLDASLTLIRRAINACVPE
jgi:CO/xanthine dehydrogenase FAD-binding subunit